MILYRLRCEHGHEFEEWFGNGAEYDSRAAAGGLTCPECGSHAVSKAIMAPNLGKAKAAELPPACPSQGCGGCAFAGQH
ncbi:DUF1178 family protein [Phaeospirillum tilakii]|uniref:DUF1178 family protein n=1 Tax=Phaeospirillum tilakii TaxID=741673 RepID=A0ABW5CDG9_9PROT